MKGFGMKRYLALLAGVLFASAVNAQYVPSMSTGNREKTEVKAGYWHRGNMFQHLDVAFSLGTTGIGIDVAMPVCEIAQVRMGYDFMPHFRKSISSKLKIGDEESIQYDDKRDRKATHYTEVADSMYSLFGYNMMPYIDMTSRLTMNNFKFMVDVFPLSGNKKLHFTVGFFWGPSQFAEIRHDSEFTPTLQCVSAYNGMYPTAYDGIWQDYGMAGFPMGKDGDGKDYKMTPSDKAEINISVKTNSFKPYLGVGYEANLLKKRDDFKFAVTGGLIFWGGKPSMVTPDGKDLTRDVSDIPDDMGSYVSFISKLVAFPAINVRIIKNIF